jgi:DNA-binding transcriptional LysR family regulator
MEKSAHRIGYDARMLSEIPVVVAVAQVFELGIEALLKHGKLVNLFPDWSDEHFPLYVYHTSRHFVPAKLRVFLDFLGALVRDRSQEPESRIRDAKER